MIIPRILVALLLASLAGLTTAETAKPNLIVILCDDLGYQDPGCFGSPLIKTSSNDRTVNLLRNDQMIEKNANRDQTTQALRSGCGYRRFQPDRKEGTILRSGALKRPWRAKTQTT